MPLRSIFAIPGSTRKDSSNHSLIKAIVALTENKFSITVYEGLATLPQFNPDDNFEHTAAAVVDFRKMIAEAEGVIICTPEYAHGVPGALKNAIDWTVGTGEFSHKPVMLITASTDGSYGHKALLETLRIIEAENIDKLQLLVPFIKTKINASHIITHLETLTAIQHLINDFEYVIGRL